MEMNSNDRVNPIRLTDEETGEVYELDFSRESVRFVENQGFKIDETFDFPVVNIPKLFYYSFRKNHRRIARSRTDALLEQLGGLTEEMAMRLIQLYNQAVMSNNIIQDKEDLAKNAKVTVEMD